MKNSSQNKKNVIVAISGGIDSAVAALISLRNGFKVIGVTLYLHDTGQGFKGSNVEENASKVCEKLNIEHRVIDAVDLFTNAVLRTSWEYYNSARTPNPCAICNRHIKFGFLLDYALRNNADMLVTGHHTKIVRTEDFTTIQKGSDQNKDQSYFLYNLTSGQLKNIYMPIGDMTKDEVRQEAEKADLVFEGSKESQDTCFSVFGENFAETLRKRFTASSKTGNFILPDGTIVGTHNGIHNYTIGQRRGLGIALGVPAFVVDIDETNGNIIISTDQTLLFSNTCSVENMNWLIPPSFLRASSDCNSFSCNLKVRYRSRPVHAEVILEKNNKVTLKFKEAQRAVTSGQAAVLYHNDLLIGGGIIV